MSDTPIKQSRWRSKLLWAAIAAQVLAIASMFGLWQAIGVTEDWVSNLIAGVLQLFAIIGIVNDPTSKNQF